MANNNNDLIDALMGVNLLEYPRDFFHHKTGCAPKTHAEAALFWQYRLSRPTNGLSDRTPPNGKTMKEEMLYLRSQLRDFIGKEFFCMVRDAARELELKTPDTDEYPYLYKDVKSAIGELENTPYNQRRMFELVYKFHKNRNWQASAIDEWFRRKNMVLKPSEKTASGRVYSDQRGGFSAVARYAKSQIIMKFMNHLYTVKNWRIAIKTPTTKDPTRIYTKVSVAEHNNDFEASPTKANLKTLYYVVTRRDTFSNFQALPPRSRTPFNVDKYVSIDYDALALEISLHLDGGPLTPGDLRALVLSNSYEKPNTKQHVVRYLKVETSNSDDDDMHIMDPDFMDEYIEGVEQVVLDAVQVEDNLKKLGHRAVFEESLTNALPNCEVSLTSLKLHSS